MVHSVNDAPEIHEIRGLEYLSLLLECCTYSTLYLLFFLVFEEHAFMSVFLSRYPSRSGRDRSAGRAPHNGVVNGVNGVATNGFDIDDDIDPPAAGPSSSSMMPHPPAAMQVSERTLVTRAVSSRVQLFGSFMTCYYLG